MKSVILDSGIHVCISKGNSKMGAIPSVSLPAILTCPKCGCNELCYATKGKYRIPNVSESIMRNLKILREEPEKYWREVKAAVMMNRFFRFHVSGDIPNYEYFLKMVETATENPHCEILCFTKRYGIVNKWIEENGGMMESLPQNLHMVFSGWIDLTMDNPYDLPEAHVRFKNGVCQAKPGAFECYNSCTACTMGGCGCWKLKKGEQVVFNQH